MLLQEKLIVIYAAMIFGTALVLSALEVQTVGIYYSLYLIEFLVLVELVGSFKRSLTKILQPVALAFFLGFVYIVAQAVIQALTA